MVARCRPSQSDTENYSPHLSVMHFLTTATCKLTIEDIDRSEDRRKYVHHQSGFLILIHSF